MNLTGRQIKLSIIDVGTNNILFVMARKKGDKIEIIDRRSSISALGKNMKDNFLTQSAIRRTRNILNDFISQARMFTDNILVIGTSCSREAENISQLSNWLWKKHQLRYLIISGEQEAYFNGLANSCEFPELDKFLLFDIGGGSTEFTLISHKKVERSISLNLGIRRLQNEFGRDFSNKEKQTEKLLESLHWEEKNIPLVGIGGTVTSLIALKLGLQKYSSAQVHKTNISMSEIDHLFRKIRRLSLKQIADLLPFDPKRSDILLTGTMIVNKILAYFKADNFFISDKGFQFGILNLRNKDLVDLYEHTH